MDSARLKRWKAKLKAAKAEKHQWLKVYNRAERAVLRVNAQMDELEKRIANDVAKAE